MRPDPLPTTAGPSGRPRSSATGRDAAAGACPVAETLTRVHAELRAGRAPSFEAMLAYGVPTPASSR